MPPAPFGPCMNGSSLYLESFRVNEGLSHLPKGGLLSLIRYK